MQTQVCATIAAIIAALKTDGHVDNIYSCRDNRDLPIHVRINGNIVTGYDADTGAPLSGTLPYVYHYGTGSDLEVILKADGSVTGFDHDSGMAFAANVTDKLVMISDGSHEEVFTYRRRARG